MAATMRIRRVPALACYKVGPGGSVVVSVVVDVCCLSCVPSSLLCVFLVRCFVCFDDFNAAPPG